MCTYSLVRGSVFGRRPSTGLMQRGLMLSGSRSGYLERTGQAARWRCCTSVGSYGSSVDLHRGLRVFSLRCFDVGST